MFGQLGFGDHLVSKGCSRRKDHLSQLDGLIGWSEIDTLLRKMRPGRLGRPPYPPIVLFKALLLQRWYTLSDEALEDALCDRLSFRHFVGLGLEEPVPDASTLCRFRTSLAQGDLGDALFAAVMRGLDARGLVLRQGTHARTTGCGRHRQCRHGSPQPLSSAAQRGQTSQQPDRRIRGRVEAVFGTLKRSYRRARLIYNGLARNQLDLLLTLIAMNLRKARVLSFG